MKTWIIKFQGNKSSGRKSSGTGISNGSVEVRSTTIDGALELFNSIFQRQVPVTQGPLWIQITSITTEEV